MSGLAGLFVRIHFALHYMLALCISIRSILSVYALYTVVYNIIMYMYM